MSAPMQLSIEGIDAPMRVRSFTGRESIHWERRLSLVLDTTDENNRAVHLDPDDLIGSEATLRLGASAEDDARVIPGIVDEVEEHGGGYTVVLVAATESLARARDFQVFVDEDAVAIATRLLEDAGFTVEARIDRSPPKRALCVQSWEDNLEFILRILAEEGIALWTEATPDGETVILGDNPAAYAPIGGSSSISFRTGGAAGLDGGPSVIAAELRTERCHDVVSLSDYDEERPAVDQTVRAGDGRFEHFEVPGGYREPAVGQALAEIRRQELRGRARVLVLRTDSRRFQVGYAFELEGAPRQDMNAKWLVLSIEHRGAIVPDGGEGGHRYVARIRAVPADIPFRPPRRPRAAAAGVHTMDVTGPSGAEIHTDNLGRIKGRLRWDRRRGSDDRASSWIRPVQPLMSGGFLLPRAGWEVLVGFAPRPSAAGDLPFELGRLVNGAAPPAESMPAQKARSAFGSATSPGGGGGSVLRTDDAAGNEGMLRHASRDYNERTENDRLVEVTGNDTNEVGGNHTITVGIEDKLVVLGSQSATVSGNREVTTVGAFSVAAAGESVTVGGLRQHQVGGDYTTKAATLTRSVGAAEDIVAIQEINRHVTGASTVVVGSTWAEIAGLSSAQSVLGQSSLTAGGALTVRASNAVVNASVLTESYASYTGSAGGGVTHAWASGRVKVGGALTMKGAEVLFKAKTRITIRAGGVTITITPGAIKVKGKIDGDAESVVSGRLVVG